MDIPLLPPPPPVCGHCFDAQDDESILARVLLLVQQLVAQQATRDSHLIRCGGRPLVAGRIHRTLPIRIRSVPDDLLGPGGIREHVLSAEAVDARRLREETALPGEDALPRVEEHLATRVDHRQLAVSALDDGVEVLDAKERVWSD